LWYCGALSAFRRREFKEVQHLAEGLRGYARDHGVPHWTQFAICLEGAALAAAGRADQGIILIQEGIRTCEATRSQAFRPAFLAGLAEAQLRAGRWDEAEQTIETALRGSEHTFERWMDAELWRLKGQVATLSRRHTPEQAEALFRRAAACADRQGSRPLHLRALTSLARLWGAQRRSNEVRDLLGPIYGWFTEGFDAPDLREARVLLDAVR
jgi:predicted ATPase